MSDDGFLGRWSRRKRGLEPVEPAPEATSVPQPSAEAPSEAVEAKTETEILEELDLPVPESLGPGDDFSAFMRAGVPDWLRRRALRRLWGTNPVLANLDELLDYGEDFTDAASVVADLQSAWRAGRGYARDETTEPEPPAPEAERSGAEGSPSEALSDDDAMARDGPGEEHPEEDADGSATPERVASAEAAAPMPPIRRRMRFDFDRDASS